jgi:hypothetical protein
LIVWIFALLSPGGLKIPKLIVVVFVPLFEERTSDHFAFSKASFRHLVLTINAQACSLFAGVYESAGFTVDDVPSKLPHTNYFAHLLELEPTFQVSPQHELHYGTILILSRTSHIPIGTLQDGRKHLLVDSSWERGERYGLAVQLLTDEEETELAAMIRRDYLSRYKYHPQKLVTRVGRQMCRWRSADYSFDSSDSSESERSDEDIPFRRRPVYSQMARTFHAKIRFFPGASACSMKAQAKR